MCKFENVFVCSNPKTKIFISAVDHFLLLIHFNSMARLIKILSGMGGGGGGGRGNPIHSLNGYVPLARVWFSRLRV